jgi:hypothetical protein
MKSLNNKYSPESIKKMQQIQVTLELPEFLRKFFYMGWQDAEVLSRMLGYVEPEGEEIDDYEDWYENQIQEQLNSFIIIKSLGASENLAQEISKLTEDQYLSLLQDQAKLEQLFKQADETDPPKGSKKPLKKEKKMTVETIEKSQFEAIQKQADEMKVELQKALDLVKKFESEKIEAIVKARKQAVKDAVKDEATADVLFKAAGLVESDEDFQAVVKALGELATKAEKSVMFQEMGADAQEQEPAKQESAVVKAVKAQLAKAAK